MARLPQTLIVLALLGATAAAFAVTERLKLERSPITGTRVDRVFSPVCECARDVAVISFVLRRPGSVTVQLLDSAGERIRTLVRDRDEERGRVSYTWDGRDDLERIVEDGVYRPRVLLEENGRTIVLPNPIRIDTRAPRIRLLRVFPRVFSPDGDGRRDRVVARYEIDEAARAMMLVDGRRRVLSKFRETAGQLVWFGRVNRRAVRPGTYEIRLRAFDRAGNRGSSRRAVPVVVRFVELRRDRVEVVAGRRFSIGVSTDAVRYRWIFAGEKGTGRRRNLVLRAPETPGEYRVIVTVRGRADSAEVVVTEPPPEPEE
ncbi:MAG: FlgD immunoglobulin-like domain containing protein [Gaiellaceae bacterium]